MMMQNKQYTNDDPTFTFMAEIGTEPEAKA